MLSDDLSDSGSGSGEEGSRHRGVQKLSAASAASVVSAVSAATAATEYTIESFLAGGTLAAPPNSTAIESALQKFDFAQKLFEVGMEADPQHGPLYHAYGNAEMVSILDAILTLTNFFFLFCSLPSFWPWLYYSALASASLYKPR